MPRHWKFAGVFFRSAFLIALLALTVSISLPDALSRTALAHYSMADFARTGLGIGTCLFVALQIFRLPRDSEGYKVWAYLGLVLVAALLLLAIAMRSELPI